MAGINVHAAMITVASGACRHSVGPGFSQEVHAGAQPPPAVSRELQQGNSQQRKFLRQRPVLQLPLLPALACIPARPAEMFWEGVRPAAHTRVGRTEEIRNRGFSDPQCHVCKTPQNPVDDTRGRFQIPNQPPDPWRRRRADEAARVARASQSPVGARSRSRSRPRPRRAWAASAGSGWRPVWRLMTLPALLVLARVPS